MGDEILPGDRVEYIAEPVFDLIIETGEIGWVTRVEGDWIFAAWPRSGVHSVPLANVRLLPPEVAADLNGPELLLDRFAVAAQPQVS